LYHNVLVYTLKRLTQKSQTSDRVVSSFYIDTMRKEDRQYYELVQDQVMSKPINYRVKAKTLLSSTNLVPDASGMALDNNCKSLFEEGKDQPRRVKFAIDDMDLNDCKSEQSKSDYCSPLVIDYHKSRLNSWIQNVSPYRDLHETLAGNFRRSDSFSTACKTFLKGFNTESSRTFRHVFLLNGNLEIIPTIAGNIPNKNKYVHVKVSYGEKVIYSLLIKFTV
jgi:hypothetical protein